MDEAEELDAIIQPQVPARRTTPPPEHAHEQPVDRCVGRADEARCHRSSWKRRAHEDAKAPAPPERAKEQPVGRCAVHAVGSPLPEAMRRYHGVQVQRVEPAYKYRSCPTTLPRSKGKTPRRCRSGDSSRCSRSRGALEDERNKRRC